MAQVDRGIKKEIFKKIAKVVDDYIESGVSIKKLSTYFNNLSNFNDLISDANNVGKDSFEDKDEYKTEIKRVLKEVLKDRGAYESDRSPVQKSKKKKVVGYNDFVNEPPLH